MAELNRGLSDQEAIESVQQTFDRIKETGRWMVAFWRIEEEPTGVEGDTKIVLERTSCNWPTSKFGEAARVLQNDLNRENTINQMLPVNEPLPRATLRVNGRTVEADPIEPQELPKEIRPEKRGGPYAGGEQFKRAIDDGPNYEVGGADLCDE